ncbi:MAG: hypothetical protein ORN27_07940 [Rhodoluna sp.]|nr:hypothetical protein [Rhodoluna sp.]
MAEDNETPNEPTELNGAEKAALFRKSATKLIWQGTAWWAASVIAFSVALASTANTVFYYFGGAIFGSILWYRSFKLNKEADKLGQPKASQQRIAFATAGILVVLFGFLVVPEYIKVNSPGVGTCWGEDSDKIAVPVACFSPSAEYKAVELASNPDNCPMNADTYLDPDKTQPKYTCLEALKK